jgi:hypothetical protein
MDLLFTGEQVNSTMVLRGTGWLYGPVDFIVLYYPAESEWSYMHNDLNTNGDLVGGAFGYYNENYGDGSTTWFYVDSEGNIDSGTGSWQRVDCSDLPLRSSGESAMVRASVAVTTTQARVTPHISPDSPFGIDASALGDDIRICAVSSSDPDNTTMDVTYRGERRGLVVIFRGYGRVGAQGPMYFMAGYNISLNTWTHVYTDGESVAVLEKGLYSDYINGVWSVRATNDGSSSSELWQFVSCDSLP